uniref:Glucose-induced degradation protein 8 homolog n=1 Tax=Parastrongyloides trichosuri TaxID=131310 RepID=A0A0N4ZEG7_PARTI
MPPPPVPNSSRTDYTQGYPPFKLLRELVKPRENNPLPRKDAGNMGWLQKQRLIYDNRIAEEYQEELILDYMIKSGYLDAAESFCQEIGRPFNVKMYESLPERMKIRSLISASKIGEAISTIQETLPEFFQKNSELYFLLRLQELTELIRGKKTVEAMDFAQQHIIPIAEANSNCIPVMEETFALLAFDNPETSPFGHLMDPKKLQSLAYEVNAAILRLKNLDEKPTMENIVKLVVFFAAQMDDKPLVEAPEMMNKADSLRLAKMLFSNIQKVPTDCPEYGDNKNK